MVCQSSQSYCTAPLFLLKGVICPAVEKNVGWDEAVENQVRALLDLTPYYIY